MLSSYKAMVDILKELEFDEYYKENISKNRYKIDYGNKRGTIESLSVLDAANNYNYEVSPEYNVSIDEPIAVLEEGGQIDSRDLLLACIEVFDWGGVQKKNIVGAFSMHRREQLASYLLDCNAWFDSDGLSIPEFEVVWSSGWTKVYSLMFERVTIYDSRVSAFINYVFWSFSRSMNSGENQKELKSVTEGLLSFNGAVGRSRKLAASPRRKLGLMCMPNDKKRMVANKLGSWLIRYIAELEGMPGDQSSFRAVDKAAFMLGFDLFQIDGTLKAIK